MNRILALAILVLLFAAPAWADPTFDAASSCTDVVPATTCTQAHTVTGSNVALYVGTCLTTSGTTTISGVTYNGVALTQLGTLAQGGRLRGDLWFLVNPATGTNNIVITKSFAVPSATVAVSLTGVDQATPNGTAVGAQGANSLPTVTVTTATGELVVDAFCIAGDNGALTVGANQTARVQVTATAEVQAGMSTQAGADGGVMSWTGAGSTLDWVTHAVPVKPAAAATEFFTDGKVF